jgi:hypothetical protein
VRFKFRETKPEIFSTKRKFVNVMSERAALARKLKKPNWFAFSAHAVTSRITVYRTEFEINLSKETAWAEFGNGTSQASAWLRTVDPTHVVRIKQL